MKVIILAAGYATRLYPLTLTQPKPLLPVAGKPMVEHVLDNLAPIGGIDRVYVVTNAKFAGHFQKWSENYRATKSKLNFTVVNDGTTDETNKLGAIGDINYVLKTQNVDDDLIIVAGDNLFSEKLSEFGKFCREKNAPVLALYDVGNLEEIKKYNSVSTDNTGKITFFEEKSKNPTSTLTGIALYYYPKNSIPLIKQYIAEATIPTSPDASCNGFTRACPSSHGACRESGSTSARRKLWKRRIQFSRNFRTTKIIPSGYFLC